MTLVRGRRSQFWGVLGLGLLAGCGGSAPGDIGTGADPRRSGQAIAQHRIYLSIAGDPTDAAAPPPPEGESANLAVQFEGCAVRGARVLSVGARRAYAWMAPTVAPASTNFLRARFLNAQGTALYTGWIENPFVVRSPHEGWTARRCTFELPLDLPASVNLEQLHRIELSAGGATVVVNGPFRPESTRLDPGPGVRAIEAARRNHQFRAVALRRAADPARAYDFVILGDGFTTREVSIASDEALLSSDFGRRSRDLMNAVLAAEPYRSMAADLNFWIVGTPSRENGADKPAQRIERDTFYDGTYYTRCLQRLPSVRNPLLALEMASETPFDQIIMLLNDTEYAGGGGDMVTLTNTSLASQVLLHELGHSIGRLADQYFYLPTVDPTEIESESESDDWVEETAPSTLPTVVRSQDQAAFDACSSLTPPSTQASRQSRTTGENQFTTDPRRIAPNLSLSEEPARAPWQEQLTGASRLPVHVVFPNAIPRVTEGADRSRALRARFRIKQDQMGPWIASGPDIRLNRLVMGAYAIRIGNDWIDLESPLSRNTVKWRTFSQDGEDFRFFQLRNVNLRAGQVVTVELYYRPHTGPASNNDDLKHAHALNLVDRPFDPEAPGVFPSAAPSLDQVWRSSYRSRMMMIHADHDAIENELLTQALRRASGQLSSP